MRYKALIMLLIPVLIYGQYEDEHLYEAYMSGDLSLWGEYLQQTDWQQLDTAERTRLINYEYGYIPFQADKGNESARQILDNYKEHIEQQKTALSPAQYTAYKSAACAYEYLLNKHLLLTEGYQSFKLARRAVDLDNNNPLALSLYGNVCFYAPTLFGGNKKKALQMFLKAEHIMANDTAYHYLWNYPALQLCIAQCYDKQGETMQAIQQCEHILAQHPTFKYVSEEYLPQLRKQLHKSK